VTVLVALEVRVLLTVLVALGVADWLVAVVSVALEVRVLVVELLLLKVADDDVADDDVLVPEPVLKDVLVLVPVLKVKVKVKDSVRDVLVLVLVAVVDVPTSLTRVQAPVAVSAANMSWIGTLQ
jgi:hypothetical protein